jgi:hypothetical protein
MISGCLRGGQTAIGAERALWKTKISQEDIEEFTKDMLDWIARKYGGNSYKLIQAQWHIKNGRWQELIWLFDPTPTEWKLLAKYEVKLLEELVPVLGQKVGVDWNEYRDNINGYFGMTGQGEAEAKRCLNEIIRIANGPKKDTLGIGQVIVAEIIHYQKTGTHLPGINDAISDENLRVLIMMLVELYGSKLVD